MTENRREEMAAPAIVARIRTLRRDWILSLFGLDIRVRKSNILLLSSMNRVYSLKHERNTIN